MGLSQQDGRRHEVLDKARNDRAVGTNAVNIRPSYSTTHPVQAPSGTAVGSRAMMSWRKGDIFRSAQNLLPVVTVSPICFAVPRPTFNAREMTSVLFDRVIDT
jgi:hypothetical protein